MRTFYLFCYFVFQMDVSKNVEIITIADELDDDNEIFIELDINAAVQAANNETGNSGVDGPPKKRLCVRNDDEDATSFIEDVTSKMDIICSKSTPEV